MLAVVDVDIAVPTSVVEKVFVVPTSVVNKEVVVLMPVVGAAVQGGIPDTPHAEVSDPGDGGAGGE